MRIIHKNMSAIVETVKFCKMLDGVKIYLFHVLKQQVIAGHYIVAVKRDDVTLVFKHFIEIKCAIQYYLDLLCQYA